MSVFKLCEIIPSVFVMHCLVCTSGGHRHLVDYKFSLKPDAFHEVIRTILQCSGQLSGFLLLCGTEDKILSILATSYTSINQTKYIVMKDLLSYERKHKYQLFF